MPQLRPLTAALLALALSATVAAVTLRPDAPSAQAQQPEPPPAQQDPPHGEDSIEAGSILDEGRLGEAAVTRVAGGDRVATSIAVSRLAFESATVVVLARADDFADALVAAPLAYAEGGPLLLTGTDGLAPGVEEELRRLDPERVVLMGGEAALSLTVEKEVARRFVVRRIAGNDRYDTAAEVARRLPPSPSLAIASGTTFPDALAAAPWASVSGRPILLAAPDQIPPGTLDVIAQRNPSEIVVVGGPAAVAPELEADLQGGERVINRLAGGNRIETGAVLHDAGVSEGLDPDRLWLATAFSFPDALAAGPAVAATGASLLLVDGSDPGVGPPVGERLRDGRETRSEIVLLGGQAALAPDATARLQKTLDAPELPGGGRSVLPEHRVVAYYGGPTTAALGVLGEGTAEQAAQRLVEAAAPFATPERPAMPAMELIVTTAQRAPGPDGDYSIAVEDADVQRYLDAARSVGALLVLDIQPGRSRFLPEVQRWERFLREPDVGLALDPEWRMGPNEVPGRVIGDVQAEEVNEVARWLSEIVRTERLPEKVFIVHQFRIDMLPDRDQIERLPGLETTFHIDGFGGRGVKLETYGLLTDDPTAFYGFKLFIDEDTNIFSPAETNALTPSPDFVSYQ